MSTNHSEQIVDVFCDVLDKLAFLFGEQIDKTEVPRDVDAGYIVEMSFEGPRRGEIAVLMPKSICPELAANILGISEDDELATQCVQDALKEIVNILCGQLLTSVAGTEPVFDLSVPVIADYDSSLWCSWLDEADSVAFLVDDRPVLVRFIMSEAEAA